MRLVGKVHFSNQTKDSDCMRGETEVLFVLPQDLRKRRMLKLKYFGFYASLAEDHPDKISGDYTVENFDDTPKIQEYIYRGQVKQIDMRVESDNGNLLQSNIIDSIVDDVNGLQMDVSAEVDFISFPALSETHAFYHDGVSGIQRPFNLPLSISRGHSKMYDLNLGYIESNANYVKVKLSAKMLTVDGYFGALHNQDSNTVMDSISFVLELQ